MFGLFAPRCPLDTHEKAWVEWRMRWLADNLGANRMRFARVVLPTAEFFPDPYHPDEHSARLCFNRVCGYLGVNPHSLTLSVLPDETMPGAVGIYEGLDELGRRKPAHVFVAASQLATPTSLIATLAHEIGHEILLGGGLLTNRVADHEEVTDLLTVFLGLGVFSANATIHESSWNYGATSSGWSIGRQGYLSAAVLGYAQGVFAYVRGEPKPTWARHLRPDARGAMRRGSRYLYKTGDSLFRPDTLGETARQPTAEAVA